MKEYKIFKFYENMIKNIVFLNTLEDLYYFIDDIYEDLYRTEGDKFSVIVDLLLQNGFSFNRFIMLQFDGRKKYNSFIINSQEISEDIKQKIKEYLIENRELLNESSLDSKTLEFIIKE